MDENVLYVKSTLDKQAASVIEKYFPINPDDGTRECNNELFDCRLAVPKTVSCIKQTRESISLALLNNSIKKSRLQKRE